MLIFSLVAHIESQDHALIWDPYDVWWLIIMHLMIKCKPDKNISLLVLEILQLESYNI